MDGKFILVGHHDQNGPINESLLNPFGKDLNPETYFDYLKAYEEMLRAIATRFANLYIQDRENQD